MSRCSETPNLTARETRRGSRTNPDSHQPLHKSRCLRHRDVSRFLRTPLHYFDDALRQLLAERNPIGNPDEVGILELDAGTLIAIVQKRVEPRGFTVLVDRACRRALGFVAE